MALPLILRVFKDNQLKEVKQFTSDQVVIGNGGEVDLILPDASVAPIHAIIEKRGDSFFVGDLGSQSGTFKNNVQILDEVVVSGDEVRIGPFKILFFIGVPKPKVQAPEKIEPEEKTEILHVVSPTLPVQSPELIEKVDEEPVQKIEPKPKKTELSAQPEKNLSPADSRPQLSGARLVKGEVKNSLNASAGEIKTGPKGGGTYAPPSYTKDLSQVVKPGQGPVVEIVVSWRERVLETFHFHGRSVVFAGATKECRIDLPQTLVPVPIRLVEINDLAYIIISDGQRGELITDQEVVSLRELEERKRIELRGAYRVLRLEQGEAFRLELATSEINIFIRYKTMPPKVMLMPLFPFTAGEVGSVLVTGAIVLILALWVGMNRPDEETEEEREQEVLRLAQFVYEKQKIPPPPPPPKVVETPVEAPKPKPEPQKNKITVADKTQSAQVKGIKNGKNAGNVNAGGRPQDVVPNNKVNRPNSFTSNQKGGAVKTGPNSGASASSNTKDVKKLGIMGAFGGGGVRQKLDEAYAGAGDVLGDANKATGFSGSSADRAGDDLGSRFKDVGAGGKGTATEGISGSLTKGRGSGSDKYGAGGIGLGDKEGVSIDVGGGDAEFFGTVDREAVKRVVQSKKSSIRRCYEKELNKVGKLSGRVNLEWRVTDQGRVEWARIKSTQLNNKAVEECLRLELLSWRFPEPPDNGTYDVDYPFVFKPE